ncbi:hypothetical protein OSB04_006273 [Centaurea solstitialis]|uniref:Reverse transcriptase zinc-binding domain-containing protein n=1 Tax=Centaurea solstitialis TaxID=347529 RepID=A0AA38U276_9ASTR|nr:hypothetical protein OSB04_006273 [Centaurea solstitialis]
MANWMGCRAGSFHFDYLGLLVREEMKCQGPWSVMIEKFAKRPSSWKIVVFWRETSIDQVEHNLYLLLIGGEGGGWVLGVLRIEVMYSRYRGGGREKHSSLVERHVNVICVTDSHISLYLIKILTFWLRIRNLHPVCEQRHKWRWKMEANVEFSVKKLMIVIESKYLSYDGYPLPTCWKYLVPRKVNIFVWQFWLDAGSIWIPFLCPCCKDDQHTQHHCLSKYRIASRVSLCLFQWWKIEDYVGNFNF